MSLEDEEIKKTDEWQLYEKGKSFLQKQNFFEKANRNIRMYLGDQWHGAKLGNMPLVQYNFIKPIVKYKVSNLNTKDYEIIIMSNNYDSIAEHEEMDRVCNKLNSHISVIWEQMKMDRKYRRMKKDSAILGEGIIYFYFKESEENKKEKTENRNNEEYINTENISLLEEQEDEIKDYNEEATELMQEVVEGDIEAEILNPLDVFYGNENEPDIQRQPYILIKKRMDLDSVLQLAKRNNVATEELSKISPDKDVFEQAGDAAKEEVDDQVLVITKLYKKNGTVHYTQSTKTVIIVKDADMGLKYYPLAHMIWEDVYGSSRGIGEVEPLIENQIETNKTLQRRAFIIQQIAYPKQVVDIEKVKNPSALNKVGGRIELNGVVDDINKCIGYLHPTQTSSEAVNLQNELIQTTKELANASDVVTGSVNPEQASGKAILAVQEAAQQPLTEQANKATEALEDIGMIIFDIWRAYNVKGMNVFSPIDNKDLKDIQDGTKKYEMSTVSYEQLEKLKPFIKIEVTPKSAYDKYAQEQSFENLLVKNIITFEEYVELLDTNSVMNKRNLVSLIRRRIEKQRQVQAIQEQANEKAAKLEKEMMLEQKANQIEQDVQMNDIANQTEAQAQAILSGGR